ncbi:MAG: hypothetical protein R2729_29275 [Bryobacteraceae bacterium]
MKITIPCAVAFLAASLHGQPYYHARVLDTPGSVSSGALGINQDGTVVGFATNRSGGVRAHRWMNCGAASVELASFGGDSGANAINDLGMIVGHSADMNNITRSFSWLPDTTADGEIKYLGGSQGSEQRAVAINNNGIIAGTERGGAVSQALLYLPGQAPLYVPSYQGEPVDNAVGVNDSNFVAAAQFRSDDNWWGLMLVPGGKPGDYTTRQIQPVRPDPDVRGLELSLKPEAINKFGAVTGAAGRIPKHAFRSDNYMEPAIDLGTLNPSDPLVFSEGRAINSMGWVAGSSQTVAFGDSVAIVHNGSEMIDLNTRLVAPAGWNLRLALGINDKGQIVGMGRYQGKDVGFLLTPTIDPNLPAPPCLAPAQQ